MQRKQLAEIVAREAGRPVSTIENTLIPKLQSAGLLPGIKGTNIEVDATYKINVLLGAILDHRHGVQPGATVDHWRKLKFTGSNKHMADNLNIDLRNAGAALDSLIGAPWKQRQLSPIELAKFEAKFGVHPRFYAEFHNDGYLVIVVAGEGGKHVADFRFGKEDEDRGIDKVVRVNHPAFERLAAE